MDQHSQPPADISPAPHPEDSTVYEFQIYNLDMGAPDSETEWKTVSGEGGKYPDKIEFEIEGRRWSLRRTYRIDGRPYSLNTLLPSKPEGMLPIVALQVPADEISEPEATEYAEHIGWLLGLALGDCCGWSELYKLTWGGYAFQRRIPRINQPGRPVQQPLKNAGDGRLARFLEVSFPQYSKNSEWWRTTIHWYSVASCATPPHAAAMVYAMLLERIGDFGCDTAKIPKTIGQDLARSLSDSTGKRKLAYAISALMVHVADGWKEKNSNEVLEDIGRRNDNLVFKTKVKSALNLKVPPRGGLLDERNALVHEGISRKPIAETLPQLALYVTIGLLRMLGYEGRFYSQDLPEQNMEQYPSNG